MFHISKDFRFEASHQLTRMPDGHPCKRMHGHSYRVRVTLTGHLLDDLGMVTDYHHLTPFGLWLKQNWDHQHLNDVLPGCHPTAEAIASYLFNAVLPDLLGKVPGWGVTWWVDSVGVSETAKTWAVYTDE